MPLHQDLQTLRKALDPLEQELVRLRQENERLRKVLPKTVDVNDIPGRRMYFTLHMTQAFTVANNDGLKGQPMFVQVARDGLFVMTSYPVFMWKASAGGTFGRWRPISHWPLPDQVVTGELVSISYQLMDAGPARNMQNAIPVCAGLISTPGNHIPLPRPQVFEINSVISVVPTYQDIQWTDSTAGILAVEIPGYKIVQ